MEIKVVIDDISTVENNAIGDVLILPSKGDKGTGIASVTKTSTVGLVDTYTIMFTDGTSTTFTVTNGDSVGNPLTEAEIRSLWV